MHLMNIAGRTAWVKFVLTAIPIYVLIAVNVPKWFVRAIDKLRRGYILEGRDNANGRSCRVAWDKVQRPLDLGGLGVLNLEMMGWALQIRWLWLRKTDTTRPWHGLELQVHPHAHAMTTEIGDGNSTLFWTEKWLMGASVAELAPQVFAAILSQAQNQRTVAEALNDHSWPRDIQGGLSLVGLFEYFQLWDAVHELALSQEPDHHIWRLDSSGIYSAKSAYRAFHSGAIVFEPWQRQVVGSPEVQGVPMVGHQESLLDSRSTRQEGTATSGEVSSL